MIGDYDSSQIELYDSLLSNHKIKSFSDFHTKRIRFLKYLSLNGYVASCSEDSTVNIWNPNTGESIQKYTEHTSFVDSLDQIDEDTLVSGSNDFKIRVWKISTGLTLKTIDIGDSVFSIKSLSNGLVACGMGKNINLYEYSTGNLTKTLSGHYSLVSSIELLNEQFMASGSSDKKVIIWDLTSYSIKYNLSQHESELRCVQRLSSNLIASADLKGQIIIWNWLNGTLVHKLIGHNSSVYSLDLYDDQRLISGSYDKTIKLWDITSGQLIKTINTDIKIRALAILNRGKKEFCNSFALLFY